jgi:protein tyrosine phosphatase
MQRMQMVQSELQYILVHEAVLEACYTRKTAISTANFAKEFAKLQDFEEEFSRLIKLARPLDKSDFKIGSLPTVLRRKNREPLFIPPDSVRVVLHLDDDSTDADYVNTEEGADYINASYIDGYYKRNFFIVTQAPLPSTVTDMWKMVFQQNVTAIVNLAQPDEYGQYWPSSGSESYGQLRVNWLSEGTRKAFTVYKMQLIKVYR